MRPGGTLETALAALLQLSGLGLAGYARPPSTALAVPDVAVAPALDPAPDATNAPAEAAPASPVEVPAAVAPPETPRRVLRLARLGTNERVEFVPFESDGTPRAEDMEKLARFFAPATKAKGEVKDVAPDPRLVDLLLRISAELDGAPLVLVSGHRRPGKGTSRTSYHVKGMAADIAVQGKKPADVRKAAIAAGALGVGLYPGFVHVDARTEPYRWSGGGGRKR